MTLTRASIGYTLRIGQLIFSLTALSIALVLSIIWGYKEYFTIHLLATLGAALGATEASFGLRAISSPRPFKRITLLWLNNSAAIALLLSVVTLAYGSGQRTPDIGRPYPLSIPAACAAMLGLICVILHIGWFVPAKRKAPDGLVRYTALQGWQQDTEVRV